MCRLLYFSPSHSICRRHIRQRNGKQRRVWMRPPLQKPLLSLRKMLAYRQKREGFKPTTAGQGRAKMPVQSFFPAFPPTVTCRRLRCTHLPAWAGSLSPMQRRFRVDSIANEKHACNRPTGYHRGRGCGCHYGIKSLMLHDRSRPSRIISAMTTPLPGPSVMPQHECLKVIRRFWGAKGNLPGIDVYLVGQQSNQGQPRWCHRQVAGLAAYQLSFAQL
jgi:hypothetical protein